MKSLLLAFALAAAAASAADLPVPDGVTFTRDLEFANPDNQHLQVNLAQPKGDGPFPAVVCIHGGGFRAGKRESYDKLCLTLAQHGYVAITLTYRLAPVYQSRPPCSTAKRPCAGCAPMRRSTTSTPHASAPPAARQAATLHNSSA